MAEYMREITTPEHQLAFASRPVDIHPSPEPLTWASREAVAIVHRYFPDFRPNAALTVDIALALTKARNG
jgi:hypothetical protein